ncbi:MAG: hypothetical protein CM15mV66_160 [uncultured marine virus]|nr:MAG: hypothetical protein CM15mV66_160 [uncultured marine virus]
MDDDTKTKNLNIWNEVKETDPRFTKKVSFGARSFTSIDAHYQIRRATEVFGPVGTGWGYDVNYTTMTVGEKAFQFADVSIWISNRNNVYGPIRGCNLLVDAKGRVDDDAPKKALTDALTKALSHLGFNSDVFMGMFDSNKYVKQLEEKYKGKLINQKYRR